jgi:hypothetical protein
MKKAFLNNSDCGYTAPVLDEVAVRIEAGFVLSDSTSLEEIPELPSDGGF